MVLDQNMSTYIGFNNPIMPNTRLEHLPKVLFELADLVRQKENRIIKCQTERGTNFDSLDVKIILGIPGIDNNPCICLFHRFPFLLVEYLMLIGLIDCCQHNNINIQDIAADKQLEEWVEKYCNDYAFDVCPNIVKWRNKFNLLRVAMINPHKNDNREILEMSAINTITYEKPRIYTGGLIRGDSSPSGLPKWSLTEEHERLSPRLWPQFELSKLNSKNVLN